MGIMKSVKFQCLKEIEGVEYVFSTSAFRIKLQEKSLEAKKRSNIKVTAFYNQMADHIGVSQEAIKNWKYGYNGPADLVMVEKIAEFLEVEELLELLEIREMEEEMCDVYTGYTERDLCRILFGNIADLCYCQETEHLMFCIPEGESETYLYDRLDEIRVVIDYLDVTEEQREELTQLLIVEMEETLTYGMAERWAQNQILMNLNIDALDGEIEEAAREFKVQLIAYVLEETRKILNLKLGHMIDIY